MRVPAAAYVSPRSAMNVGISGAKPTRWMCVCMNPSVQTARITHR